ncbi:MAG: hypothetical protein NUW02_02750 [Candidatus Campbellbacteria bacterium]|nr:hypothetical protein [Candidatus Campbellbacteria bacterium]
MLLRRTRTYGFVLLVVALLVSYAYYESRAYIHGPQLIITAPIDGFSVKTEMLTIEGTATNITAITLNDRPIFVDETGHFKEDVLLMSGYNVLTLAVTDRYERKKVQYVRGIYTPSPESMLEVGSSTRSLEDGGTRSEEDSVGTSSTTTLEANTTL